VKPGVHLRHPLSSPRKRKGAKAIIVLPLLPLLIAGPACAETSGSAPPVPSSLAALSQSLRELAGKVHPCVVKVVSTGFREPDDDSGERGIVSREQSSGSGVIIDPDGYVVTNAHVVAGADGARVTLASIPQTEAGGDSGLGGRKVVEARIVGLDPEADVALLKVPRSGLPYLPLADSERVRQGQVVVAFGSPMGLEDSVTFGIVSSTARQFDPEDPIAYLQTDAAINPGNSGGPLVDTAGRVVGINTLILSQSGGNEGLGFAVPSNVVSAVVEQLRRTGRSGRGDIGIEVRTVTPALAAALGLPAAGGVMVRDVEPESAAQRAGIRPGDLIASVNGKALNNVLQLTLSLYRAPVGSTLRLGILRDGQEVPFAVEVHERAPDLTRVAAAVKAQNLVPQLGIFVMDLDQKLAEQLGQARGSGGVLVAAMTEDGPSFDEDLRAGDIIYRVNRQRVSGAARLRELLNGMKPGDAVAFEIERDGQLHFLALELP
jgi:serine protease Do